MKCSQCYAENKPWATVCSSCGLSILRLETCPMGHLLPPGGQECPVCPSMWPEVGHFAGPPVLRGFLWVERGRLANASDPRTEMAYVEVRDQETPLALASQPAGALHLTGEDDPDVDCRILMRPESVQVCNRTRTGRRSGPPVYEPLPPGQSLDLGGTSFRYLGVQPPVWVEKLAGSLQEQE
ncbi:hypothetical protein ACFL6M_04250, partial [Candidatus Eisenbacteria bacterium]